MIDKTIFKPILISLQDGPQRSITPRIHILGSLFNIEQSCASRTVFPLSQD